MYHYDEGRRAWGEDALFDSSSLYPHLNIYVSVIMYVCMRKDSVLTSNMFSSGLTPSPSRSFISSASRWLLYNIVRYPMCTKYFSYEHTYIHTYILSAKYLLVGVAVCSGGFVICEEETVPPRRIQVCRKLRMYVCVGR